MKTTIYELLGMIKDNNIPQRIIFKGQIYEYVESAEDYYNEEYGYIFDVYVLKSILNEPVEILETTITYKPNNNIKKIKSLNYVGNNNSLVEFEDKQQLNNHILKDKINEIIDKVNSL